MNDQMIMQDLLNSAKGVADLYLHGTIESATPNVHQAFDTALDETLCMQSDIYQKMSAKGWYPTQQAEQQQVTQVKQKFTNQMQQ
ncbi:MAG: spore coat protein [Clostridiales bacterium]